MVKGFYQNYQNNIPPKTKELALNIEYPVVSTTIVSSLTWAKTFVSLEIKNKEKIPPKTRTAVRNNFKFVFFHTVYLTNNKPSLALASLTACVIDMLFESTFSTIP